jgi:cytoskeleton protein RodZ
VTSQTDGIGRSEGIGARLRDARERAGLSLIEAAEKLHVEPHAIEALEAEDFEKFGASVYVRGHIRHYAELVGESPDELQQLYAGSAHAVRPPDLTRVPHLRGAEPSPAPLAPGVAIVLSVALVGLGWWIVGNFRGASGARVETAAGSAAAPNGTSGMPVGSTPGAMVGSTAPVPVATPAARAVAPRSGTSALGAPARGVPARGAPARGVPARGAAEPEVLAEGRASSEALAETSAGGAVDPDRPRPAVDPGASQEQRGATGHSKVSALQLHFNEDSWAEVYDARGERLLFDVGSADSTRTVSGTPPLRVVLGNPAGVALELNGRIVSMPEGAARNVSIEFRINRSGRVAPSHLAAAEARNEEKKPGRD